MTEPKEKPSWQQGDQIITKSIIRGKWDKSDGTKEEHHRFLFDHLLALLATNTTTTRFSKQAEIEGNRYLLL